MSPTYDTILTAQSEFALQMLRFAINTKPESSVVLSPISVSIALSMVLAGAANKTKEELSAVLGKNESTDKIHKFFHSFIQTIMSPNSNYTLDTANKVFVQNSFPLTDEYVQLLNSNYFGQFESVDFLKALETAKIINDFAEEKTRGKIKDLVDPSSFNALTRLVLVNAIYFKGKWVKPFEKDDTKKTQFYVDANNSKEVDMMFQIANFPYIENDDLQMLGLPYVGNSVYMYLILPKQKNGLNNLVKGLNASTILSLISSTQTNEVEVSLPRFKVESEHFLIPSLKAAGINEVFTDQADLTGISKQGNLSISDVLQKAFIETNEEGSEAAAATAITFRCSSVFIPKPRKVFTADHPFLYLLTDQQNNILFNGVVRCEK